jgi:hypothetical protein
MVSIHLVYIHTANPIFLARLGDTPGPSFSSKKLPHSLYSQTYRPRELTGSLHQSPLDRSWDDSHKGSADAPHLRRERRSDTVEKFNPPWWLRRFWFQQRPRDLFATWRLNVTRLVCGFHDRACDFCGMHAVRSCTSMHYVPVPACGMLLYQHALRSCTSMRYVPVPEEKT